MPAADWHWPGQPPCDTLHGDANAKACQDVSEPMGQQHDPRADRHYADYPDQISNLGRNNVAADASAPTCRA
jgi:hypothetical protein